MFSKLWWIFAIIGTSATLLNPYVGIFGFFNVVELFIMCCIYINFIVRLKLLRKHSEDKVLIREIKAIGIDIYIISVVFFLIKLFVGAVIFILSYADNTIMAPYEIWSNPQEMSIVCLIIELIFNVLLLISLIGKGKFIRKTAKEYE